MHVPRRTANVLIVEEEPAIALILEDMLMELGFKEVRIAYDLAAARDAIGEANPDLAILEVNGAQELVFALAARLRAQNVAILFSTGKAKSEFPTEWWDWPLLHKLPDKRLLNWQLRKMGFE